jgi:hypothetical protein
MGVFHLVGGCTAVESDGGNIAVCRQRVSDVNAETSRNGGRSRILATRVAGRSADRPITDSHIVNREIGPRARKLRNNRDFAARQIRSNT